MVRVYGWKKYDDQESASNVPCPDGYEPDGPPKAFAEKKQVSHKQMLKSGTASASTTAAAYQRQQQQQHNFLLAPVEFAAFLLLVSVTLIISLLVSPSDISDYIIESLIYDCS